MQPGPPAGAARSAPAPRQALEAEGERSAEASVVAVQASVVSVSVQAPGVPVKGPGASEEARGRSVKAAVLRMET